MSIRLRCAICGGESFSRRSILWPELIKSWQLSTEETQYIDRQQGEYCTQCGANLRSVALANALRKTFRTDELLRTFCGSEAANGFRVLEINEAGSLHPELGRMHGHVFARYPDVDIHSLPYLDGSFDVVVHSDTLEHVKNPCHALAECRRVLSPNGTLCFTVPIIVARLSRSRDGLPKSWHGNPQQSGDDFLVQTEFGADAWTYPLRAGFSEVSMFGVEYPAAVAIAARL